MSGINVKYINRFICDATPDSEPVIVDSGISAYDGLSWIKEEQQRGRQEHKPRILDKDEITRFASIRVSNAEFAAASGAILDQKYFREGWQRRQVRKENRRDCDMWSMSYGWIGHDKNHVIHPQLIKDRQYQKAAWRKFAENRILTGQDGQEISMLSVMERSEKNRRAELYTLVKGIQKVAEVDGLTWGMLTLTCPPRFHPKPSKGLSSWDGSTPEDAHKWLHHEWRGVLRRLAKKDINISGVRFSEYHKDGCPHWHVLFYTNDLPELMVEVRKAWTTEAGADFVIGDPKKGSFASYCMSYLAGDGTEPHVAQYDAKRAIWSQRFIQFFGVPRIGLWRATRAMPEAPGDEGLADSIWRAARRGDGAAFIALCGGLAVKNKERPAQGKIERTPAPAQAKTAVITTNEGTYSFALPVWKISRGVALIQNYPRDPSPDLPLLSFPPPTPPPN